MSQLSKKYGPVFTVHLGPQKTVVLAGFKAVKEALVTNADVFGEREVPQILKLFTGNNGAHGQTVMWWRNSCSLFESSSETILMDLDQAFCSPTATRGER